MQLEFSDIKVAVEARYAEIIKQRLFRSEATKDELWETYLGSFPEGTNPMFRERTEHDCACCKNFVRNIGNMIAIIDGKIATVWDINIGGAYQVVADAMAALVRSKGIKGIYLSTEGAYGADQTVEYADANKIYEWQHFYGKIPSNSVCKGEDLGGRVGHHRSSYDVFHRALQEIKLDAIETVEELVAQNSLYRGEEFLPLVKKFKKYKITSMALTRDELVFHCWLSVLSESDAILRVRNSVIGTLLCDLSDGMDIELAVKKFEDKVAPTNYKRPTALITASMIKNAQAKVAELGFEASLHRRFAVTEDITINNVLFADRESTAKMAGDPFDELQAEQGENAKAYDHVEEVFVDDFIKDMLPLATKVDVLLENKHAGNMVSLIAPEHLDAKGMFKWHNNFSFAYAGEMADSMKENIKNAGGDVTGDLRFSIQWNDEDKHNQSDYDAHCNYPGGLISFRHKRHGTVGGKLDVDIQCPSKGTPAVENITFERREKLPYGKYEMLVHNYSKRSGDTGFRAQIEFDGIVYHYDLSRPLRSGEKVKVADVHVSAAGVFSITHHLDTSTSSKEIWGVQSQQFVPVEMVMFSPNHWDDKVQGNKHFFFMMRDCLNPDDARGFFNEFLVEDLNDHRKVFEVLGSKMKALHSDNQLSGLGFSSTQRNTVVVRLTGAMQRVVKVVF